MKKKMKLLPPQTIKLLYFSETMSSKEEPGWRRILKCVDEEGNESILTRRAISERVKKVRRLKVTVSTERGEKRSPERKVTYSGLHLLAK